MIHAYVATGCPEITEELILHLAKRLHKNTAWAGTPVPWEDMDYRSHRDAEDRAYAMLSAARTVVEGFRNE